MFARIAESGICLDEASTEHRCRNAESQVRITILAGKRAPGRLEVGLHDVATWGISPAGNDKEIVHLAVVGSVRIPLKPASRTGPFSVMNHGICFALR
jgi:hypothetical protein